MSALDYAWFIVCGIVLTALWLIASDDDDPPSGGT